jgi:hypothetical protein
MAMARKVKVDFTGVKRPRGRPGHRGSTKQTRQGALTKWAMELFYEERMKRTRQKVAAKDVAHFLVTEHLDYVARHLKMDDKKKIEEKLEGMIWDRRTDKRYKPK